MKTNSWQDKLKCPDNFAVAGLRHDAKWISSLGPDVEAMVYQQDDKKAPNYYSENGNEAGAYLQFIIDFYDCLPNVSPLIARPYPPKNRAMKAVSSRVMTISVLNTKVWCRASLRADLFVAYHQTLLPFQQ